MARVQEPWRQLAADAPLDERLKAAALWLAATTVVIENAATMTESFDESIWEWRLNRPVLGKGDVRIAHMFEDMADALASHRTRVEIQERLELLTKNIGELNRVIIDDDGTVEELLKIVAASDEINEDHTLNLFDRIGRRLSKRFSHLHSWISRRVIKRMGQFFRFAEGDPYGPDSLERPENPKRDLGQAVVDEIAALLQPGDIMLEKKTGTVPDLLIPGYWGHTALWLGSDEYLQRAGVYDSGRNKVSYFEANEHRKYIAQGRCVLEAVFTGVILNNLRHFTYCNAVAVLRLKDRYVPAGQTREQALATILKRGLYHAGQDYDFWFNVNSHNRIVCSELVFQAFPKTITWPTVNLINRPTISPDNVACLAGPTDEFPFEVVYFVEDQDVHRGPDAWKGFWQRLKGKEGRPFDAENPDHAHFKAAAERLEF